jgi:hypothetical protein
MLICNLLRVSRWWDRPNHRRTRTRTPLKSRTLRVERLEERALLSTVLGDFNGDRFTDLAIAAPQESIGAISGAGAVSVLYGSRTGLSAAGSQFWHQGSPGIADHPEAGDHFGSSLATGDFNGDGFADLAVGVTDEDLLSPDLIPVNIRNAGAVHVLYGSPGGLTAAGGQFWHQDSPGIENVAEAGDGFGSSLAAGDFNGDGRDDLAVGVLLEDIGSITDAGAVHVLYGASLAGLTAAGDQFWHQGLAAVADEAERGDHFGAALAVGDFDGDRFADLAIGVTLEDLSGITDAGAVNVLYGSASVGLTADRDQFWHQNVLPPFGTPGLWEEAEAGDLFGGALAAGDFNGDGRDDLAVGISGEDIELRIFGAPGSDFEEVVETLATDAGAVNVLYGKALAGLTLDGSQFWSQDSFEVLDAAEDNDRFGWSLAAGDFNGDGRDDLAVGVPYESYYLNPEIGAVNVIYGSTAGLNYTLGARNQLWDQGRLTGSPPEAGDHFGWSLAAGDFNGDGADDLAVGVPDEDMGATADAGVFHVLYGMLPLVIYPDPFGDPIVVPSDGLAAAGNQFWHQALLASDGIESGDGFGRFLVARR